MVAELVQLLFAVKIQLLEPLEMAEYFTIFILFQSWAFVFIYYYFISCKVNYTPKKYYDNY